MSRASGGASVQNGSIEPRPGREKSRGTRNKDQKKDGRSNAKKHSFLFGAAMVVLVTREVGANPAFFRRDQSDSDGTEYALELTGFSATLVRLVR